MLLQVITYPNEVLTKVARQVSERELKKLREILPEMTALCKDMKGFGLAAPQIGISKKFFIMDLSKMTQNPDNAPTICIINPEVISCIEPINYEEGCLSLPGVRILKQRYNEVELSYKDENWQDKRSVFIGGEAVCALHEIDHLHGGLLWDTLSRLKQNIYKEKTIKFQRKQKRAIYG